MWKCFLQFTAVAISMKFKLEEPPCALSLGAKPHCRNLGATWAEPEKWMDLRGIPTPRVGSKDHPSAVGAQACEVWYRYTGNLLLCYKIICISSNSFKGFFPLFFFF